MHIKARDRKCPRWVPPPPPPPHLPFVTIVDEMFCSLIFYWFFNYLFLCSVCVQRFEMCHSLVQCPPTPPHATAEFNTPPTSSPHPPCLMLPQSGNVIQLTVGQRRGSRTMVSGWPLSFFYLSWVTLHIQFDLLWVTLHVQFDLLWVTLHIQFDLLWVTLHIVWGRWSVFVIWKICCTILTGRVGTVTAHCCSVVPDTQQQWWTFLKCYPVAQSLEQCNRTSIMHIEMETVVSLTNS